MSRLTGLDALRGIAALLVLLGHTSGLMGIEFGKLYLAVDFFFMLSGYVMARTYERRMADGGRVGFLRARVRRLWPTMILGAVLAIPGHGTVEIICGLLMIPMIWQAVVYPLNPPAWSIFFELFANVVHSLGIYRLPTRFIYLLCVVLLAALAVFARQFGWMHFGPLQTDFGAGFLRVLFSYFLGICLYRTWKDRPPINVPPIVTLALMPALLVPPIGNWAFDIAFVSLACPLLVAGGLTMGAGRIGSLAGAMSFPLYAIHIPVRNLYMTYGIPWPIGLAITLWLALVAAMPFRLGRYQRKADYVPEPRAGERV